MPSGWKELLSPVAYSHRCRDALCYFEDLQGGGCWDGGAVSISGKNLQMDLLVFDHLRYCLCSHFS